MSGNLIRQLEYRLSCVPHAARPMLSRSCLERTVGGAEAGIIEGKLDAGMLG